VSKFFGVIPAVITPLGEDSKPDENALRAHVDFLVENGVHGLWVLGSIGEFPYLNMEEKKKVAKWAVDEANGKVPTIVVTGSCGTDEAIEFAKYIEDIGADAVGIVLPTYWPLREEDAFFYFKEVASSINIPAIAYNVFLVHFDLTPEFIAKLSSEIENIVGVKDTVTDVEHTKAILKLVNPKAFSLITGSELHFLTILKEGGHGGVFPTPNFDPTTSVKLYEAFKKGNMQEAEKLNSRLLELIGVMAYGPHCPVAVIKESMRLLGRQIRPKVKKPLAYLTDSEVGDLKNYLREIHLTEKWHF